MAHGSSNPTSNLNRINGVVVDTSTGNASTGTQRVVLATNQPAIPVSDNGSSLTVDGTVTANQGGTWTVQPGNTANTTPWLIRGAEYLGTATALGALNANISQALTGTVGVAAVITATSTPTGIVLTPQVSYDGGTNWVASSFYNVFDGVTASTINSFTVGNTYSVTTGDGATHVRVIATSWTSGSVTVRLSASNAQGLVNLRSGALHDSAAGGYTQLVSGYASSTAPTAVANGDAARLWTTTSGALNIADGGGSLTVDGTVGISTYTTTTNGTPGTTATALTVAPHPYAEYRIRPSEVMRDPVDKMRVSNPQSLIDTDFEYGIQPTKWESLTTLNNRPTAFYDNVAPLTGITNITASGTVVTIAGSGFAATVGQPLFITGTLDTANADGWWIVDTASATSITFRTLSAPAAALWDATKVYVWLGQYFTGSAIPLTSITTAGTTTVTVTTTNFHGLKVGNCVSISGTSGVTGGPINGTWLVASVPTTNTFTFTTAAAASGTITGGALYVRQPGFTEHRPYDGGVQFSNETAYHGYQDIRQTRRYFRYQAGKGIQYSTGTTLKPPFYVDNITSSGTACTITTKYPHGLLTGATIVVAGASPAAYNGTFTVTATTPLTISYTAASAPGTSPATGFPINVSPNTWYGGSNRIGMFDQQNGFFFEHDGTGLYYVIRKSVDQCSGRVSVTANSTSVVGTNTKFAQQLKPGDQVVIRGMNYMVASITSETQMYIYPEYRGVTTSNCVLTKTVETRTAQTSGNIDPVNGTGRSGFNLDLTKMQMFYADYSWYGAGAIRFGFKNQYGEVIYAHRIVNSNVNYEAYMRSGNLPARYETNTLSPYTYLTATLANTSVAGATISVADTSRFPSSGTCVITAAGNTGAAIEYITYSAKTATTLTIAARAQVGGNTTAQTFTYSATAPIKVELHAPQAAQTLSHWGSSVIMDGRYDDDKSLVFNAGMTTAISNKAINSRVPLISIRLAPTVDNGLTGLLGYREIINRMQLTLRSVGTFTTGSAYRIELLLNARISGGTFAPVTGSASLSQVCIHAGTETVTAGESIFTFYAAGNGTNTQELNLVRDLGNSILGGCNSLTYPSAFTNKYPDGPDIITIIATPITNATNSIVARLNWTEAQA